MPLPPVSNGVSLSVEYDVAGHQCFTVLGGYRHDVATPLSVAEGQRWLGVWRDAVLPHISTAVIIKRAEMRYLAESPSPAWEIPLTGLVQGQVNSPLAFGAASWCIKWQTGVAGRRGRGRTFLPGVTEAAVSTNGRQPDPAVATALQAALRTTYLAGMPMTSNVVSAGVVSRADLHCRPVTSVALAALLGTQRRRMR